jgi:hypothetical protein
MCFLWPWLSWLAALETHRRDKKRMTPKQLAWGPAGFLVGKGRGFLGQHADSSSVPKPSVGWGYSF